MKLKLYFLITVIASSFSSFGNDVTLSNVILTGQNRSADFTLVQFDIRWENSWRTASLESNWDAVWVFIKWRKELESTWHHGTLNTSGHTSPVGATVTPSADGRGVFIYRSTVGMGANTFIMAQLQWNYGIDGLNDNDHVEVSIFAIEMVYIPQGVFYVGDGGTTNTRGQLEVATTGLPFQVSSEAAITLGGGSANSMGNNNAAGQADSDDFNDVTTVFLQEDFPKGYKAFYIMKYEITQEQYVSFLNTLTYTQQATRTTVAPNSPAGTNALNNAYRNGIDIAISGVNSTIPAVYACNLNNNTTYNEVGDGQAIACNYLTWADLVAYLDWAGLRPFTELEYEKACRGTLTTVTNEFAWGNTSITGVSGITNSGLASEVASNNANAVYNNTPGPMRVGCFAKAATTRITSGASYYGVMELSGNMWERAISIGTITGRAFTGQHGDGRLTNAGQANVANWPDISATGAGWRGGSWITSVSFLRTGDRTYESSTDPARYNDTGGRGVRTAP